jgi:hypothetical protein
MCEGPKMLRYKLFENFKWSGETLLVWGDKGFADLAALFRTLAREGGILRFCDIDWMVKDTRCSVEFVLGDSTSLEVHRSPNVTSIVAYVTADDAIDFADKIAVLAAPGSGHQYLDFAFAQTLQIMVSKGEYPEHL